MSVKKKFDFTTLFVVLVSIGLILLGMYFLNQAFTKKESKIQSVSSSKSNLTITTASSSNISEENKSSTSQKQSESSASSSLTNSALSSNSSSSSSTSSKANNSPLSTSEAKVKVAQSLGGGSYEVEVIDTGLKDPKFWIKDKKIKINNTSNLNVGGEYRVSEITETSTSFNYGSITE
jgi:cytoskeletal protein RodZ